MGKRNIFAEILNAARGIESSQSVQDHIPEDAKNQGKATPRPITSMGGGVPVSVNTAIGNSANDIVNKENAEAEKLEKQRKATLGTDEEKAKAEEAKAEANKLRAVNPIQLPNANVSPLLTKEQEANEKKAQEIEESIPSYLKSTPKDQEEADAFVLEAYENTEEGKASIQAFNSSLEELQNKYASLVQDTEEWREMQADFSNKVNAAFDAKYAKDISQLVALAEDELEKHKAIVEEEYQNGSITLEEANKSINQKAQTLNEYVNAEIDKKEEEFKTSSEMKALTDEMNESFSSLLSTQYGEEFNEKASKLVNEHFAKAVAANKDWYEGQSHRIANESANKIIQDNNAKISSLYAKHAKEFAEQTKGSFYGTTYTPRIDNKYLDAARVLNTKAASRMADVRTGEGFNGFGTNFAYDLAESLRQTATLGAADTPTNNTVAEVFDKLASYVNEDNAESVYANAAEYLNEDEMLVYDAYCATLAAELARAKDTSYIATTSQMLAEMVPFFATMGIFNKVVGGANKFIQNRIMRGMTRFITNKLPKVGRGVRKAVTGLTTDIIGSGVYAAESAVATMLMPRTYAQTLQNKVDIKDYGFEGGKIIINELDVLDTPEALLKTAKEEWAGIYTEGKGLTSVLSNIVFKNPIMKKVLSSAKGTAIGKLMDEMAKVKALKLFRDVSFNGTIGEWSEELEGAFWSDVFGNDKAFEEFFSKDTQIPMIASFMIPSAIGAGFNIAHEVKYKNEFKKASDNAMSILQKHGYSAEDFSMLKDNIYATPTEDLQREIVSMAASIIGADQYSSAYNEYTTLSHKKENVGLTEDEEARLEASRKALFEGVNHNAQEVQQLATELLKMTYAEMAIANIDRSEKERLAEAREMARGYAQATEQMLAEQQAKEEIDTAIENGEEVDDATLEQHTREKVEEELMPTLVGIAFENGESEMGSQALYRVSRPDDTERKGYIVRGEATPQVEQGDEGLIFTNKDALVTVKWDDGTIEQTTLAKLNIDSTSTIAEQIEEEVQKQFLVARGKQTYKQGTAVTMQVPNVQTGEQETLQGRVLSTNENGVEVELVAQDGVTTTTNVDYASATQVLSVVPQQPSAPSAPSQSTQNEPVQASVTTPDANTMNAEQLASSALSFFDNDKDAVNGWIDAQAEEAKREIQELQKTKPTNTDAATYKAEWQAKQTALNNAMKRLQTLDQAKNIIANAQNAQQNANNSQNTLQSGNNSVSLQGKKSAAQEVIDNIDSGHFKTIVFNDENIEQLMRDAMLSQESIGSVMQTLATHGKGSVDGFYDPSTGVVFVYENQSKDKVRRKYVHERQHGLNAKNKKYINAILRVSKEKQLKDVVERISGTDFYSKKSLDIVADEFICRAMEIAYSVENDAQLENALRRIGASEEQIQIIKSINYEHGQDFNLSKARRTPYVFESTESTSGQSSRDSEEIPNRVLGQQGFRPSRPSESRTRGASEVTQDTSLEESGIQVNDETGDARFSVNYRLDDKQIDILAKQIAERVGVNKAKAKKWLKAETSLAALCMQEDNVDALYYFADGRYGAIKNNSDYPQGTVDFNNICRKRLDFTNIYLSLQREFPNKVFTAKDLETIRQIMIEDGLEVACGLCYVEDRRQLLGEIANEFRGFLKDRTIPEDLSATKKEVMQKVLDIVGDDAYIPTIAQLLEAGAYELRNSHPSIFEAFVVFNNSRGMQSGRLFEGYAEYKREILDWSDKKVKQVNDAGGLRIFSFSDFEAHHLIDIVQIINDAASKGVMIQGYTKVPEFARAIRSTKIKLNRSLIPLGDTGIQEENGNKVLAYDTTEGIDVNSENFLDESNNPNVGNVLVGINDEQIRMAMEDANVNFIIPFHTGLKKDILLQKKIGAWVNYKNSQTEKDATTSSSKTADGKKVVGINIYTDVLQAAEKEGTPIKNRKEFVEYFLKVCKERGLVPRFEQFLARGKNGEYRYTKGYEKLLVDFKMFDKRGNILPQEPVVPIFDDAFNQQIIEDYVKGTKETKEYESTKEKIKENLQLNESTDDLATSESQVRYSVVTDKKLLNELENGETIKVYRAMQLQDGKLYPPMSGKVEGEWRNPIELGVWEQADEAPDKAVERKGKDGQMKYVFKLDKGNKKSLYAAYNPYIHTSRTPLNDQFSEAQDRPELVTVEVEVPTSELTSGYKAKNAKDAVGELEWKAGVVQGQLTGTRKVILSRYDKPIRIVPNAEVAERIVEMIDGKDVVFPSNVVTPQLREELEKKGVQFKETDNQGKPRFSVTEGTQVVNLGDNTLVGLHNISQSKIRKAIKQGGLANPSAAVIDIAKQNHEGYGEITLVMPSKLVESETGRNAGTYTGDAWSPTYPYVELQLTEKGRDKYYDTLRETFKNEDVAIENRMALVFENMLSNQGNPENLAYWYLLEKGIEPTKVMFNSGISDFVKERFATLREKGGVDNLNAEERELLIELAAEIDGKTKEDLLQEAQDRIKFLNITANSNDGFRRIMALATLADIEEYGVSSRVLSDAFYKIDRAMIEDGKLDVERTVSNARNYVEEQGMLEDLNSWIENLRNRFGIKEVIFDGYDRNGNRKYVPNTLSNVSRLMNRESEQNAYSNTGLSATRAMLIERLETLEDIRNNKHRLVAQSEQEQEEWDQMQDKWFNDVIEPLSEMQKVDSNPFINNDIAALRLIESVTKSNPIAYLNREYKYNIPLNGTYAKTLNEMIKQLKEMPTKYFETKFKRPVYLNEFSAAVVPQGLAEDVKTALQGFGMPLFEYDESVEGSRREATLKATEIEGVRFSIIGERGAANLDRAEEATTRLDNLSIAREMENANKDAKTIKAATGWERGADGKWRYEVDDIKLNGIDWITSKKRLKLGDIIDDNGLFKAYPQLADIHIKKNTKKGLGGSYNYQDNSITLNVGELKRVAESSEKYDDPALNALVEEVRNIINSTIVHEIQHAIQYTEGFAKGGNPSMYRPDFDPTNLDKMIDDYNEQVKTYNNLTLYEQQSYSGRMMRSEIKALGSNIDRIRKHATLGLSSYKRLAGEVEARNAQKRASMSEEERRNTLLQETEDVAREDQIFIYHNATNELATIGTAFSGGGLLEAGLEGLIDPQFAIEYDEKIAGVYRNNHGDHILVADIIGVDMRELASNVNGTLDYFHASPVCKNYSSMKNNNGEVELDINTARATANIIRTKKPKVVTIENVKRYKDSKAMEIITKALDEGGYTWDANVYNAADYGAATSRERLIVRATRVGELPSLPSKVKEQTGWFSKVEDLIEGLPNKELAPWMVERLKEVDIDPSNISEPLFIFDGTRGKIRYAWASEPLPTITASGTAHRIVLPNGEVKMASPRVMARITGLPDSYELPTNRELANTIIGNGIPTDLTKAVIAPMLEQFQDNTYSGVTKGEDAKFSVSKLNSKFNKELQMQIDGTLPQGHIYDMGVPSVYLQSTGIPALPLRLQASVLNRKANDSAHEYRLEEIKDLVKLIQKPIAIFRYGDAKKAQNLMIGISQPTAEGKQFLVGISINPKVGGKELEVNSIRNVFPKNYHDWIHWINDGKMLRVDGKEEIQAIIDALRINPVDYINVSDLDSAAKIVKNFDNPKLFEEKSEDSSKNVSFSVSNTNQRIFVSNAERAVESIKQEKATPQQWKAMIEKQGGLKVGEDKWLGLSEWLDSKVASSQGGETKLDVANRIAKNTIAKQEILDYIAEHQIQIEEVNYAEDREETRNNYEFEYEKWVESFEMDIEDGALEEDADVYQLAFDEMVSKYGDDFAMAFEVGSNGELQPIEDMYGDNSAADYFLGGIKAINETRLKYTTKGLENKQEIALTVPTIESWNERDNVHFGDAGDGRAIAWIRFGETEVQTPREVIDHVDELQFAYTNANGQDVYAPQGSKFSKDYAVYGKLANGEMGYVLYVRNKQLSAHPTLEAALDALNAHYEANPRQETDYGKVLVIDEIQSNRHQEGREKGYATKKDRDIKKKIVELTDQQDALYDKVKARPIAKRWMTEEEMAEYNRLGEEIKQLQSELSANNGIIPDAPFDKNWHELAFKRMLRYAAENGFDYVAWTTGAQQAERYNLGQVVKEVHADKWQEDTFGFTEDGGEIKGISAEMVGTTNELQIIVDRNGKVVVDINNDQWVGHNLSEIFGKEAAVKLMADGEVKLDNIQLRIGGDGMKGFYDKMLPSFVSKYTKKWGAKVQDINLPNLEKSAQTMHAVNVTQEMKDSVMEGQPMFSISAKEAQEYADAANEFAQLEELKQLKSLTNEIDYFTESRQFGWRDAKEKEFWGIVNSLRKNRFVKKLEAIIREAAAKSMPNTKVVDKKGRPLVVYHGTISKSKFNEFDTSEGRGLFFVKQEWQAKQYTHPRRTLWVSPSTTGRVIPAFINIENPYVIDAKRRLWRNIEVSWSETPVTTDDIVAYAKENGHDGVIIERVRDNMFDDDTSYTTEYIPFNSSQVKSTGAVYIEEKQTHFPFDTIDTILTEFGATYDDDGNLIPLSERFNLENADVRFSVKSEDPKPIGRGVFGYIYDQFKGKTQEAIDFLLRKKDGEALGALHHNEVGEIALVYGNNKGGLGKISIKHPEVLGNLQEIFDEMNIVQKSENRIKLESNTHFAVVSKDYKGTPRGAWLLTAFEKTNSVPDNTMDTGETLSGKQNDTATLQDTVSADKGTKNIPNDQINSQENENLSKNPLFSVVNPTRQDVVTEALIRQASESYNKMQAAMKQVNYNLRGLHKVARLQREYDKGVAESVLNVVSMFMQNNWNAYMPTTINKLFRQVRNAIGKKDITNEVNTIMEHLTDAQMQRAKNEWEKLLQTKTKKVNVSGVVTQGKVGAYGQYALETLNGAIDNKLTLEDLEERLSDIELLLGKAKDESERTKYSAQREGYIIAMDYLNDVVFYMRERESLKQELKNARNDASLSIDARNELVDSLKRALRENNLDTADAYIRVSGKLQDLIEEQRSAASAFVKAQEENRDKIIGYAKKDLEGVSSTPNRVRTKYGVARSIWEMFSSPIRDLQSLLRLFGKNAPDGEGYLYNHFMRGWVDAADEERKGTLELMKMLDAEVERIFGGKYKTFSDVAEKMVVKSKKDKLITISMKDIDENREYDITIGNALYIYAVNKMEDGKMKLRAMNITEEQVENMVSQIDPDLIKLVDWVQDVLFVHMRDKYNPVHERLFGAPMDAIDNYFPLKINSSVRQQNEDLSEDNEAARLLSGTSTSSIKRRTRNTLALDVLNADFFKEVVRHIVQMERWASFAQWNRDANILISNINFRNAVKNMSTIYGKGDKLFNYIKDVFKVSIGSYKSKTDIISETLLNIAKGVTSAKINFRLFTAFKQLASFPAFFPYMTSGKFVSSFASAWVHPKATIEWAKTNLPSLEKRISKRDLGDMRLMQRSSDWELQKKMLEWSGNWGMSANIFFDTLTCAAGAKAVYDSKYAYYVEIGMSSEDAKRKARQDAEQSFNTSQQSSEGAYMAPIQVDRNLTTAALTVFRTSSFQYTRNFIFHLNNLTNKLFKKDANGNMISRSIIKKQQIDFRKEQYLSKGLTDSQAQIAAERDYKKSYIADVVGIVTYGALLNLLWRLVGQFPYLIMGDDEDKKKQIVEDALSNGAIASPINGIIGGNVIESAIDGYGNVADILSPQLPLAQDAKRAFDYLKYDKYAEFSSLALSIAMQAGTGIDPLTAADMITRIATTLDSEQELDFWEKAMRISGAVMSIPQSQYEQLLVDQINSKEDVKKALVDYQRYYSVHTAPLTWRLRSEEEQKKIDKKAENRLYKLIREREEINQSDNRTNNSERNYRVRR